MKCSCLMLLLALAPAVVMADGFEPVPATQPGGSSPPIASPADAAGGKRVTNVFYETSLRQALSDVAAQTGVVIVPDFTVQGVVTCELKDVPLSKALEILLAGTGYAVKEMPGYLLVCSPALDGPSYALVSQTQVLRLDYAAADAAVKMLSPGFRPYAQADATAHTVCVTAPPAVLKRIVDDLKQLDVAPRHVMLNARVVVLEQNDLLDLGVRWTFPQIRAGLATNSDYHGGGLPGPDWPWGIEIGYTVGKEFTNSLLMMLNLLASNDEATIVASPQVVAQDHREAQIKVTTDEYFQITTPGAYYVQAQLEKIESGTILRIIPRIGDNSEITLEMEVEVSDVVARGENDLPVVSRRQARSVIRIEDGGTAAVAGLMDSRSQVNQVRVPGLGKAPGVGRLFRNDSQVKTNRQLAVFITARIVRPDGARTLVPAKERPVIPTVGPEFRTALQESLRRIHAQRESE
ncbi:MAG: Type IV pilus biogenesis and competence protein PilQ [Phycisphaerae bacterium]|nr:Type IV pilus biogenesis and competence protein PilQ [Phycisphaerae bacterium]